MKLDNKSLFFIKTLDFQKIVNTPIMGIAAQFWDNDRFNGSKICYKSMRIIDDLVDNRKIIGNKIPNIEKKEILAKMDSYMINNRKIQNRFQKDLLTTTEKFQIPLWPWKKFSKAMIYDLNNDSFKTFYDFIKYSEGAAVAPASIFMHFCGIKKNKKEYISPNYDIQKAARPIALFAYLVHIIRDFQKDQKNNLNYFAKDIMIQNKLTTKKLKDIANGVKINNEFRNMMKKYYNYTNSYRKKAEQMVNSTSVHLEPRYQISLKIIYDLYNQIFDKIDITNGEFTTKELNPSTKEVKNRIKMTISSFKKY
ncbi:MAG: squalene/phytoene synthase family protein [Candidatus Aenigmarchaeota archaeon]|nr:squalene/phytoene synthase family protein [Candidatus Aenigmarchaeota archaeon]